jgi:glucokinase
MLLAGDIGGTKTILAVFSTETGGFTPVALNTYPSAPYDSLESIVQEFLGTIDAPVSSACFAVAGPIFAGRAQITNLPWVIEVDHLKSTFGWHSVDLINDLEAVAYAIPILNPDDIHQLSAGNPVPGGSIAVLAPGTGLGEAYMTFDHGKYIAHASEGSHASFAPVGELQTGLLTYMREKLGFDHVSVERVCSGSLGIPHIYTYLRDTSYAAEPAWLSQALLRSDDPTRVIMTAALDQERPSDLCRATLDMFVAILGAEAGNQALKVMATGGIYLGGGIPPRILSKLQEPFFLEALRSKGRFRELLTNIPVNVILKHQAGLLGAAAFGLDHQAKA